MPPVGRGIGGFDVCLLNVVLSYVPWAEHAKVYANVRKVLEPSTGLLVIADSDFATAMDPTLIEGAHHERRPFADYAATLTAAGFELVHRATYGVSDDTFFASVWRCAEPPTNPKPKATAKAKARRARPAAPTIPGLP